MGTAEFKLEIHMRIPVCNWLRSAGLVYAVEPFLRYGSADIIAGRFAERTGRRVPPFTDGHLIELKLIDVNGVLTQSLRNCSVAEFSYAAMPASRCQMMRSATRQRFVDNGVGLLSVTPKAVEVLVPARRNGQTKDWAIRNLWRRTKGGYVVEAGYAK